MVPEDSILYSHCRENLKSDNDILGSLVFVSVLLSEGLRLIIRHRSP
jgi:hypothetical protein